MDIGSGSMELFKYGAGDAAVQYAYNKFLADKIIPHLGALGKYANVGASFLYGLAIKYLADSGFGSSYSDYLNQGAASQLGRAISVALGDPNPSMGGAGPAPSGSTNPWGSLAPVIQNYGAELQY